MKPNAWHEEPIAKRHDRDVFDCGEAPLNEFLRLHARKSHEMGGAKTFLAIDNADNKTILGFYSLSPASIKYSRTPEIVRRRLARQGRGLGGQLLLAAGRRCLLAAEQVGGVALVIDAKNDRVAKLYASFGAVPLLDAPLTLMLPLATIQTALERAKVVQ